MTPTKEAIETVSQSTEDVSDVVSDVISEETTETTEIVETKKKRSVFGQRETREELLVRLRKEFEERKKDQAEEEKERLDEVEITKLNAALQGPGHIRPGAQGTAKAYIIERMDYTNPDIVTGVTETILPRAPFATRPDVWWSEVEDKDGIDDKEAIIVLGTGFPEIDITPEWKAIISRADDPVKLALDLADADPKDVITMKLPPMLQDCRSSQDYMDLPSNQEATDLATLIEKYNWIKDALRAGVNYDQVEDPEKSFGDQLMDSLPWLIPTVAFIILTFITLAMGM